MLVPVKIWNEKLTEALSIWNDVSPPPVCSKASLGQENVVADHDNMRGPLVKPFDDWLVFWSGSHLRI